MAPEDAPALGLVCHSPPARDDGAGVDAKADFEFEDAVAAAAAVAVANVIEAGADADVEAGVWAVAEHEIGEETLFAVVLLGCGKGAYQPKTSSACYSQL